MQTLQAVDERAFRRETESLGGAASIACSKGFAVIAKKFQVVLKTL